MAINQVVAGGVVVGKEAVGLQVADQMIVDQEIGEDTKVKNVTNRGISHDKTYSDYSLARNTSSVC